MSEEGLDPSLIPGFDPEGENLGFEDEERSRTKQLQDSVNAGHAADFRGWKDGVHLNNKWLQSGDLADLTGVDIAGFASVTEGLLESGGVTSGMSRLNALQAQMDYADKALAAGAVKEELGTMNIDHDKVSAFTGDYTKSSWNDFKYNTSVQSVKEEVEKGNASSIQAEIDRRKAMEPDWTDWDRVKEELTN